ncbi:hypothetical protein Tco_1352152 [Tanacetum coccineum]
MMARGSTKFFLAKRDLRIFAKLLERRWWGALFAFNPFLTDSRDTSRPKEYGIKAFLAVRFAHDVPPAFRGLRGKDPEEEKSYIKTSHRFLDHVVEDWLSYIVLVAKVPGCIALPKSGFTIENCFEEKNVHFRVIVSWINSGEVGHSSKARKESASSEMEKINVPGMA